MFPAASGSRSRGAASRRRRAFSRSTSPVFPPRTCRALYLLCYPFPGKNTLFMKVIPLHDQRTDQRAQHPPAPPFPGGALADTLGRSMRDLRISVTDRCNFRCVYCMPREVFDSVYKFLPPDAILSFEETARLAGVFAGLGVKKLRLTGGEPLVRRDLARLVEMLSRLDVEITLTTNGSL